MDKNKSDNSFNPKTKALWTLLFLAIAGVSIWAVVSQADGFSVSGFWGFLKSTNPAWIVSGVLSMIIYILFEGMALLLICRSYGYRRRIRDGFVYSAADIYFSAITPSATGGQPASAYFMIKHGIPGTFATMALVVNLVMYTATTVFYSFAGFIFKSEMFTDFGLTSRLLIIIGFVVQLGFLTLFLLVLTKKGFLLSICRKFLKLFAKLHLIRKVDKKIEKLNVKMEEYARHTSMLRGKGKMLAGVLLFNILQRGAQIMVTVFSYLAAGGKLTSATDVFLTQTYVVTGSNCMPIPGAMGITDALMLDGFSRYPEVNGTYLELLSRSLSFYVCIFICGVTVLVSYCALSRKKRRSKK